MFWLCGVAALLPGGGRPLAEAFHDRLDHHIHTPCPTNHADRAQRPEESQHSAEGAAKCGDAYCPSFLRS